MYLEDDSPWGVKRIYHGIAFQELLIVISLMHEMDITSLMSKMGKECSFSIDTELESAQGFDDIVVWHEQNKDIVHKFIQVKHNQNGTKKISVSSLLTKSGKFSILKLFLAYLKIKNSAKFSDGIKHFLFATNMDLDSPYSIQHEVRNLRAMLSGENKGKELSFVRIDTKDEFLDIGDSARYRISDSGGSVAQYLKQNMDFIKREIGKEVSNKEIEDFLNELVFVVNLPHEAQLRKLLLGKLSSRLNKKFDYIGDNQIFCNNLLKKISDWVKDIKARPLSYKEGEELFREVELWASTLGKIEQGVKENNERIDKVIEQQHKDSKTLHKIYVAVTTQDNKRVEEPIWFKIIEPVAFFTGRNSELKALHDALQRSTVRPAIISQVATISGLGGIGKSEFARQYAYTYGKDYYANVIWINAESVETMKNSFLGLVKDDRLGISTKDRYERDKTIENIVREIYAFFARRKGKSLFIFDNAEGYENIKRFLPSSLHPRHKKPYILITSRDCKWNVRGESDIKVIQLDKFGEVEALEFVRKALNIENNLQDREIEELTRELQYFPLALGQAVVYIQDRNEESRLRGDKRFKISDYLKEYQQNAGELLKKGIYENEDRYTKTVLTTWNVTMTYICKEYGFEALNIFEIMAYLAPDDIRIKEIFSKSIADDKEKLWNAVELLNRYSMIKLREGIVNIHSPVQKVTRLKLQEKGREEEVLRKALNLVNIGDVAKDNKIHVAFIWGYASKHGKLIDDFYKDTNLHLFVENGDYKAIKNLLAYIKRKHQNKLSGIVNAKNGCDIAPLHLAAGNGELDIAKYLINEGANIDARDCFYQTPLYWAAKSGELDMVKYLVNKGASVGIKDNYGWTVLYWAVESESFDIAEYLIKEKGMGIDVSAKYSNGKTMLHEAIRFAKLDAIKYLIDKGIDINIKNGYGDTPLHWAAIREKVDVVRYFVEQGAHVNAKNNEGKTALDYVTDNQELVELLLTHDESVEVA